MTSKIKVDNINKVSDDSNIINKCGTTVTVGAASDGVRTGADNLQASDGGNLISQSGTTITLGASGDTITLASGASQSGFGREGSVNWQTGSIKTGTFTAASGEGYFVDTSSGAVTANLPAGTAGAIVAFADYTRTFATHNLTITPNGSNKIGGIAASAKLDVNGQSATFVFVDATEGWINVQETETSQAGVPPFIQATGGTITTSGDFKIHTFTGPGTFTVCNVATQSPAPGHNTVSYMVVAGGGGGSGPPGLYGGGGGAGGFREGRCNSIDSYSASPLVANAPTNAVTVTATSYPISVGGGGAKGASGVNSTFSTITSAGGGNGGQTYPPTIGVGNGGSGGGLGNWPSGPGAGGAGNTPPTNPSQGNPGAAPGGIGGGGGGGATASGSGGPTPQNGGPGGAGATTSITASPVAYAGGGGGAAWKATGGTGGTGGGGNGSTGGTCVPSPSFSPQTAGGINTGGGGGSGGSDSGSGPASNSAGGSGIVVIRYKFQ